MSKPRSTGIHPFYPQAIRKPDPLNVLLNYELPERRIITPESVQNSKDEYNSLCKTLLKSNEYLQGRRDEYLDRARLEGLPPNMPPMPSLPKMKVLQEFLKEELSVGKHFTREKLQELQDIYSDMKTSVGIFQDHIQFFENEMPVVHNPEGIQKNTHLGSKPGRYLYSPDHLWDYRDYSSGQGRDQDYTYQESSRNSGPPQGGIPNHNLRMDPPVRTDNRISTSELQTRTRALERQNKQLREENYQLRSAHQTRY